MTEKDGIYILARLTDVCQEEEETYFHKNGKLRRLCREKQLEQAYLHTRGKNWNILQKHTKKFVYHGEKLNFKQESAKCHEK